MDLRGPDPATALAEARRLRAAWEARLAEATRAAREAGPPAAGRLVHAMAELDREYFNARAVLAFPANVAPEKEKRAAALAAEKELNGFWTAYGSSAELLAALRACGSAGLDEESAAYVARVTADLERHGAGLAGPERARLAAIRAEVAELEGAYQRNLREDRTALLFTRDELAGLPEDFFHAGRPVREDGRVQLGLGYPDLLPVLKRAARAETRRAMEQATHARGPPGENAALLRRAVELRREAAALLGRPSHAHLGCAAPSRAFVEEFLSDLSAALAPAARAEAEALLALKREAGAAGAEAGALRPWDLLHLHHRSLREAPRPAPPPPHSSAPPPPPPPGFDEEAFKEFFPAEAVLAGTLGTYEALLGVRFEALAPGGGDPAAEALRWHPDVLVYAAREAAPPRQGAFLGHLLLDLYPRPGKFPHASGFPLRRACALLDAEGRPAGWQAPVSALVANLSRPPGGEARLKHGELVTLFHECGHAMHSLLSRARFARLAGTSVEADFVEAPALMLEHWAWDPAVLRRMARAPPGRSQEDVARVLAAIAGARGANGALLARQRLATALFDQRVHGPEALGEGPSLGGLYSALLREAAWTDPGPEPPHVDRSSSLLHLMCGYDGSFYGYLMARAWAAAMFNRFLRCSCCPLAGREYREKVLAPGGSRPAGATLADFLGAAPSPASLARSLAGDVDGPLREQAAAMCWCPACDACRCSCPCRPRP
eukprot:tig00021493_g21862.t1